MQLDLFLIMSQDVNECTLKFNVHTHHWRYGRWASRDVSFSSDGKVLNFVLNLHV